MTIRVYRIVVGVIILLFVDMIWVASSQLTEYLYHDKSFNKPFFSTYTKTSMFMIYLIGFIFWKPWRIQCIQLLQSRFQEMHHNHEHQHHSQSSNSPLYSVLEQNDDDERQNVGTSIINGAANENGFETASVLSESIWVPVKFNDLSTSEKSSGTESDGERTVRSNSVKSNKSVRFSRMSEVRQLADSQAEDALMARLSYQATLRAHENMCQNTNKLSVEQTIKLSLSFCLLWFAGNLSYQIALLYTQAGLVNTLSSTSSLFTIILASCFPSNSASDRFSLSKLIAVMISITSVAIISTTESQIDSNYIPVGVLWALSGAFFYAAYIVMIRYKIENEDSIDIPMFFGFVGFFNFILIWPGFFILHYSQLELFQWPNIEQWCIILVNGLIGTVFSELLWLWGCFLTSSLLASLSMSLTIPLTIIFDVALKNVEYPRLFFFGTIPLFLSFFAITLLSHYDKWDPLASILTSLIRHWILKRPLVQMRDALDSEQTQSLITESA